MIWILLMSLICDEPRERNTEVENIYEIEFYDQEDTTENDSETSDDEIIPEVSNMITSFSQDYMYDLGSRAAWLGRHEIKYINEPDKYHYCEDNECFAGITNEYEPMMCYPDYKMVIRRK